MTYVLRARFSALGSWAANNIPKWNLLVGVFVFLFVTVNFLLYTLVAQSRHALGGSFELAVQRLEQNAQLPAHVDAIVDADDELDVFHPAGAHYTRFTTGAQRPRSAARFIRSSVPFVSWVNAMEAVRRLRREDARR